MKNPRLILQILNLFNGILLSICLIKLMEWTILFNTIKLLHLIIGAFLIYGLKSWIEIKFNIKDPIKTNRFVSAIFFTGSALFIIGVLFKFMHWPFASIILISGVFIACSAFIFSFFFSENEKTEHDELIDNF